MSSIFPRIRTSTAIGALAAGGITLGLYSRYVLSNVAHADSGAPKKTFGGGPAFMSLSLESSEMVNHNTKRLRFKLPSDDHVSGLPLTSALLTVSKPSGSWFPVARPYTPITPADEPGHIDFLVKKYPSGKQSTHLHSLTPGQSLLFAFSIKGPQWKPSTSPEHITLIAGGAGITPVYQLVQGILNDPSDNKTSMTLIFGVNSDKDILLQDEFKTFERKYPERFRAVYAVSRPEEGSTHEKGYVTGKLVQELVKESDRGRVFVCGPPPMEEALVGGWGQKGALEELGFKKSNIHKF